MNLFAGISQSKLRELLITLLMSLLMASILFLLFWPLRIEGSSMQDTLDSNNYVIVSRIVPRISIKRGDIVLCNLKVDNQDTKIIKRVIGLPNENLKISGGKIYIDGEIIQEDYLKYAETYGELDIYLGLGEYFVMGDNRRLSKDSRQLGAVSKQNVIAKVILRVFPEVNVLFKKSQDSNNF